MKIGMDTSVILRLLVGQPVDQTERAVAILDEMARQGDQGVVSDLVIAEAYFALQHHSGVSKKDALSGLHRLLEDQEIEATGVAVAVLNIPGLAFAKPGFVDRLIHHAYTETGNSMVTFERAAHKLKSVRVL